MTRLKRSQAVKLNGLMDMLYKPAEVANELGISVDTIYRSYVPAGAPVEKDERGRLWIPGLAFRDWARGELLARDAKRKKLEENQGYCLRCNRVVEMVDAHKARAVDAQRGVGMITGSCPKCHGKVNRFFKISDQI